MSGLFADSDDSLESDDSDQSSMDAGEESRPATATGRGSNQNMVSCLLPISQIACSM